MIFTFFLIIFSFLICSYDFVVVNNEDLNVLFQFIIHTGCEEAWCLSLQTEPAPECPLTNTTLWSGLQCNESTGKITDL